MIDWNGVLCETSAVSLPLDDQGVVHGAIIVDRARTFGRSLFRWTDHIQRFRQSCELSYVPLPVEDAEILDRANRLIQWYPGEVAVILLATPGPLRGPPTLIIQAEPIHDRRNQAYWDAGLQLAIVPGGGLGVDPRIKHRSRLGWWIASHQAGWFIEPLMVDAQGFVSETPTANVIACFGERLVAPSWDQALHGVSLQVCRELTDRINLEFVHRPLAVHELFAADELIVTCTTWCLTWCSQLDRHQWKAPGPVLLRLSDAWSKLVGCPIGPSGEESA